VSNASFHLSSEQIRQTKQPGLPLHFLWEFLTDGRTPSRALTEQALRILLPALEGPGTIIELGAGGDYYKKYVPMSQKYILSNLHQGFEVVLDMTKLELPSDSVDAFFSVNALEHIYDFEAAIREQQRVLKPGGRMLIVVPFLYYYHAAPDDFFRFSKSALDKLLAPLEILVNQPIGGRWLLLAELLHEKKVLGSQSGFWSRFALRCLAVPFLAFGLKDNDPQYASAFAVLCEKKAI